MDTLDSASRLSRQDLELILSVTRALAAPFELTTMLIRISEATSAAERRLRAKRASVWLHDEAAGQLVVRVAVDILSVRIPIGTGLVESCACGRARINVSDSYADPRFDPSVDWRTGFRTRRSLTLPLIDHQDSLVGVMRVFNRHGGVFDAGDEVLAQALAAQCAVALTRVRMTQVVIEGERLRQELELARIVQLGILPAVLPVAGCDLHGDFLRAEATGGDTDDLAVTDRGRLIVVGDATGHGITPALAVTQMHALLRMAFRLGADLETSFRQVNDQLASALPEGRFVTADIGLLDPDSHRLRFLSGGQGPILHYRSADDTIDGCRATRFPMGAMPLSTLRPAVEIDMASGDLLAILTDGIYGYEDVKGNVFGRERVETVLRDAHAQPAHAVGADARRRARLRARRSAGRRCDQGLRQAPCDRLTGPPKPAAVVQSACPRCLSQKSRPAETASRSGLCRPRRPTHRPVQSRRRRFDMEMTVSELAGSTTCFRLAGRMDAASAGRIDMLFTSHVVTT